MAGLRGSIRSIHRFSQALRSLPRVVGQRVAADAAPELTKLGNRSFDRSETPDHVPWAPSVVDGSKVDLDNTGALRSFIRYVAIGVRVRVALGVPYAKYQVGKRQVFPTQGQPVPADYAQALGAIFQKAAAAHLQRAS